MPLDPDFIPSPGCDCESCQQFLALNPYYQWPQGAAMEQNITITTSPATLQGSFSPDGFITSFTLDETTELMSSSKKKPVSPKEESKIIGLPVKNQQSLTNEICLAPILYLIRGVPGSSKSSLALLISKGIRAMEPIMAPVFSADDFFIKEYDGRNFYCFNAEKLPEAHAQCQEQCKKMMEMEPQRPIIVANTFVSRQHMLPYQRLAREHGYIVLEIICKGNFENVHGVPTDKVRKMKQGFEH